MSDVKSITISRQEVRPFDFAKLREEAIGLVQKLSGEIWTDYNVHDPGVTILEQIVFALTELGYRTGFDVQDYLTSADGHIDYESQAMYEPSLVQQSFPVTLDEYSSFFASQICLETSNNHSPNYPENVRFSVGENGYYKVEICMVGSPSDSMGKTVLGMFWDLWREWRCMGDHVSEIHIKWVDKRFRSLITGTKKENSLFPSGTRRDVNTFFPIIELFPAIYREGESAEPLKKYLAPSEFAFGKFLEILNHFPQLFSVNGASLLNLELYNKALDQMLAMFGVQFPKFSIKDMTRLVRCKVLYLKELPKLLLHRSGIAWRRRVELMLGTLHDNLDEFEIFNVDGALENEKAGCIHVVLFCSPKVDEHRKKDVEQFVCHEIPAHLCPVLYWVDKQECNAFADLYNEWIRSIPMKAVMPSRMNAWLVAHHHCVSKRVWL